MAAPFRLSPRNLTLPSDPQPEESKKEKVVGTHSAEGLPGVAIGPYVPPERAGFTPSSRIASHYSPQVCERSAAPAPPH
jgi:hypothetical protein